MCGILHLFGHLGGAGAQLPGVSDVSQQFVWVGRRPCTRTGDEVNPFTGPQLVVFLGRMTHQKGCDTIAMAADYFLKECPNVSTNGACAASVWRQSERPAP